MAIIITMVESDRQYIAGIPEYIEFFVSEPSTVFYTIDGTTPDENSDIYVNKIYLPTTGTAFTLRAIAVSDDSESDEFSHYFNTDQSSLDGRRLVGDEGINVLKVGEDVVDSLSFDVDGYEAQTTSIEFSELDIKTSEYDSRGYENPDRTSIDFINFPEIEREGPEVFQGTSSSVNNNAYFNPKAGVIIVDGHSQEALDQQEVRIINRPQGTISTIESSYSDHLVQNPPVTGNLVRSMYNPRTGLYISYYYESKECRWIQSIQSVNAAGINISTRVSSGRPFVYKWITARHMSKIF